MFQLIPGAIGDLILPLAAGKPIFLKLSAGHPGFHRPLHKWHLNLNNNTHTSLASDSCENSFVWKHEYDAKNVQPSIVIEIWAPFMQRVYGQAFSIECSTYYLF